MDCRELMEVEVEAMSDDLVEVADAHVSCWQQCNLLKDVEVSAVDSALHAVSTLQFLLFWITNSVYISVSAAVHTSLPHNSDAIEADVTSALSVRAKLVDSLSTWMGFGDSDGSETLDASRTLQREAFMIMGDLRNMFPLRQTKCIYVDKLAYTPSNEVLGKMRLVFETEAQKIKEEIDSFDDMSLEHLKASSLLVRSLLIPLSRSIFYDIENLNRRQAAAVMIHLRDADDQTECMVKVLSKQLKDCDFTKYMEVQLVALKGVYLDMNNSRIRLETEVDSGNVDMDDAKEQESELLLSSVSFAKKLRDLLGIPRLKGRQLLALINFFTAGIDYSFSAKVNVMFLSLLTQYIRFLPLVNRTEVLNRLDAEYTKK